MLLAIPNYYLSVLKAPPSVIKAIQKILREFLWTKNMNGEKKIPLVSLDGMTQTKQLGGAGIHDLHKRNKAFGGKLVWQMYSKPNNIWCQIMQQKYLDNKNPARVLTILDPPKGSAIWDFMIASREIVTNYISWEVNSGYQVKFWHDSWNGAPPLSKMEGVDHMIIAIENLWGSLLINYVSVISVHSRNVIWKDPSELNLPPQDCQLLEKIFSKKTMYLSNSDDKVLWAPGKEGSYNIKDGYNIIQQQEIKSPSCRAFTFCWSQLTLPKAGCFSWLALKNRVLTGDRLHKLKIAQPFNCLLCGQVSENVDHLFLSCTFAQHCWMFVLRKIH
jgi:hypothetical protein